MSKLTDWLLDIVYPTKCVLCREPISPGRPRICARCQDTMPLAGAHPSRGRFFDTCVSALYYEDTVQQAILRYKFHGVQAYATAFGELVAERVYEDLDGKYDLITWVPLAPDRLRQRGYDQTMLMAQSAADRLRKPLVRTLRKRRGVAPQSREKSKERRQANIAGAFTAVDPALVAGRDILIIDDIITTGSTLSECAKTLLMAGAEKVVCATLARTR